MAQLNTWLTRFPVGNPNSTQSPIFMPIITLSYLAANDINPDLNTNLNNQRLAIIEIFFNGDNNLFIRVITTIIDKIRSDSALKHRLSHLYQSREEQCSNYNLNGNLLSDFGHLPGDGGPGSRLVDEQRKILSNIPFEYPDDPALNNVFEFLQYLILKHYYPDVYSEKYLKYKKKYLLLKNQFLLIN